jgi:hypothetical protein
MLRQMNYSNRKAHPPNLSARIPPPRDRKLRLAFPEIRWKSEKTGEKRFLPAQENNYLDPHPFVNARLHPPPPTTLPLH